MFFIVIPCINYTNQKPYAESRDDIAMEISADISTEDAKDVEDKSNESPEDIESKGETQESEE